MVQAQKHHGYSCGGLQQELKCLLQELVNSLAANAVKNDRIYKSTHL